MTDVMRDGGVLMKALHGGEGWRKPTQYDELVLRYRLTDPESGEVIAECAAAVGEAHVLGSGTVCRGVDEAAKKLKVRGGGSRAQDTRVCTQTGGGCFALLVRG